MKLYWISNVRMTVGVFTIDNMIVDTPPIVRKFKGQPLSNLVRWMKKQKQFRIKEI